MNIICFFFIVVNCLQGYYRVHYDEENWKLLAQTLEENHEVFPAETRASLIDDVLSLAAVGLTRYAIAFDFIKYMQTRERHYAPWGVLMRHLLKLNGLLYETSGFSDFQVKSAVFINDREGQLKERTDMIKQKKKRKKNTEARY